MDNTILGAVIGAGAAIAAAFIGIIGEKRKREALQREQQSASKALSAAQKAKYGFFAQALHTKVELLDLEPSCLGTREWRGLQVAEGTAITAIPGFFSITSGEFTDYPGIAEKNADFPKAVLLRLLKAEKRVCEYAIEVAGTLTSHDPKLDCKIQYCQRGGFLMSREEVEDAYPVGTFRNEYQRVYIEIPLDEVQVEIVFPVGYNPEVFPAVFMGRSEVMDDMELHRVRSGFQRTERGGCLKVDKPLLGYSYAVYWVSPSKSAVAALKTQAAAVAAATT